MTLPRCSGVLCHPTAMQGRYGIDGYAFLRWNAGYVLKCLGAGVGLLYLYGSLLDVSDWR